MKIAISTRRYATVRGQAGQSRHWLLYDLSVSQPERPLPQPERVELSRRQLRPGVSVPHPFDGVSVILTASAEEHFIRHMKALGVEVLLTGETIPERAASRILRGETQPAPRSDFAAALQRLQDWLPWR